MASPSMMINKSPYRPSDLSPYIQTDYAMPLATPLREPTQNMTPTYQQMKLNEPVNNILECQEPSLDFLKEANLIGRWKTKRVPENNAWTQMNMKIWSELWFFSSSYVKYEVFKIIGFLFQSHYNWSMLLN